jgi:hypothetical protein
MKINQIAYRQTAQKCHKKRHSMTEFYFVQQKLTRNRESFDKIRHRAQEGLSQKARGSRLIHPMQENTKICRGGCIFRGERGCFL